MVEMNEGPSCMVLYSFFCNRLSSGGLDRKELEDIRALPIGHQNVADFVDLNLKLGNFEWRGNTLVNVDRKYEFKLTENESKILQQKAKNSGLTTGELIKNLVLEVIKQ